jgi:hypothetical protein
MSTMEKRAHIASMAPRGRFVRDHPTAGRQNGSDRLTGGKRRRPADLIANRQTGPVIEVSRFIPVISVILEA